MNFYESVQTRLVRLKHLKVLRIEDFLIQPSPARMTLIWRQSIGQIVLGKVLGTWLWWCEWERASKRARGEFAFNSTKLPLTSPSCSVQKYIEVATICGGTSPSGHRLEGGEVLAGSLLFGVQCTSHGWDNWEMGMKERVENPRRGKRKERESSLREAGWSNQWREQWWELGWNEVAHFGFQQTCTSQNIWEGNHRKGGEVMVQWWEDSQWMGGRGELGCRGSCKSPCQSARTKSCILTIGQNISCQCTNAQEDEFVSDVGQTNTSGKIKVWKLAGRHE